MKTSVKSSYVTPTGGNVFADLGFKPKEAAELHARSKRIIAEKLAIKHLLMEEVSTWMDKNDLLQLDAAKILGVTRPRISDVVRKQTDKFTIDALVDMLSRAGKHVQMKVT